MSTLSRIVYIRVECVHNESRFDVVLLAVGKELKAFSFKELYRIKV